MMSLLTAAGVRRRGAWAHLLLALAAVSSAPRAFAQETATSTGGAEAVTTSGAAAAAASSSSEDDPETPTSPEGASPGTATQTEALQRAPDPAVSLHGELRFRLHGMSRLPLDTAPATGLPAELGQTFWSTQWLRLTGEVALPPYLRLIGQIDVADGVLFGGDAEGVSAARRPRDGATAFQRAGIDPRWLYVLWTSSLGEMSGGLQPSHWGLGLLANDGTNEPPFGDYRYGNQVIRLGYRARPFGEDHPFVLQVAGDLVYDDPLARLRDDDRALQAVLSVSYEKEERALGLYVVRRSQQSPRDRNEVDRADAELDLWTVDVFAQWDTPDPVGGRLRFAFEGLHTRGRSSLQRTVGRAEEKVREWIWAAQVERMGEHVDVALEAGWTSGDADPDDGVSRRGTMHPDHRIGLLLFPELLAWSSARAATLAAHPSLGLRAASGSESWATQGGVSGASYVFQHYRVRAASWLDVRFGWIWARATRDVVNPYRQRVDSRSEGWRGADPGNRDLGFEVDASVLAHTELRYGVRVQLGVEGGILFPGRAFDDAGGASMDPMGLVRGRAALLF